MYCDSSIQMQEFIEVYEDADGRIQPAYEDQGDYEEDEKLDFLINLTFV